VAVVWSHVRNQVEADGEFKVARIEVAEVVGPGGRNVVEKFLGQVAVGIDEAHAMPQGDMLDDHVPQERRLAGAGLSDHVNMLALVNLGNAKNQWISPPMSFPNGDECVVIHGSKTSRHSCPKLGLAGGRPSFLARLQASLQANASKCVWDKPAR